MGKHKIYRFELPQCETCLHYEKIRQHRGVCSFLDEEGVVSIENVGGTEDIMETLEGNVQLAPLACFGCKWHTDFDA